VPTSYLYTDFNSNHAMRPRLSAAALAGLILSTLAACSSTSRDQTLTIVPTAAALPCTYCGSIQSSWSLLRLGQFEAAAKHARDLEQSLSPNDEKHTSLAESVALLGDSLLAASEGDNESAQLLYARIPSPAIQSSAAQVAEAMGLTIDAKEAQR